MEKTKETSTDTLRTALMWFYELPFGKRCFIRSKYYLQERTLDSLTGREIEEIWRKEIGDLKLHKGEIVDESYPEDFQKTYLKPNQKQFVKFNEELFLAYINKFSNADKYKMIEIMLDLFPNGTFDRA